MIWFCYLDCDLDSDLEDAPVYMGHSLFNITKIVILLLIVDCNLSNNFIKITQIAIQIECLHKAKFLDPDHNLGHDQGNLSPCNRGICVFANFIYTFGSSQRSSAKATL